MVRRDQDAIRAKAEADLLAAKVAAKARVTEWAGAERAKYITILPGQEMIYLAKEAEAVRFLDDPDPDLAGYPFLAGEIGITGDTAHQIAQIWLHMSGIWRAIAAQIEATRLGMAAEIDAADTFDQIAAVMDRCLSEAAVG